MDEDKILEFRNRAAKYFERVLIAEGYDAHRASELAFYVSKVLEDTHSLLQDVEYENVDTDEVLSHVHLFYSNSFAFVEGRKLLMYKD